MPLPGTAPGVTVEMGMKQAVMEEAAQVNKTSAVTLAPGYPHGSLTAVRGRGLGLG